MSPELLLGIVTLVVNAGVGLRAIQVLDKRVGKVEHRVDGLDVTVAALVAQGK